MHMLSLALLFFGHLALCVAVFNRVHAAPAFRRTVRLLELPLVLLAAGGLWWMGRTTWDRPDWLQRAVADWESHRLLACYAAACWLYALWACGSWIHRRGWRVPAAGLISNHTRRIDVSRELGQRPLCGWSTWLFASLPGNQMCDLYIHDKTVLLPRLPPELDGLTLLHLSDLHLSGKITRPYFDYVIDRSRELEPDLVAITGDILEYECCYDWLPGTLGRLTSRHGMFFVLGNHDRRLRDVARLRRTLGELGLHDVGRAVVRLEIGGKPVLVAGNELPWFGPPPELPDDPRPLRILLSHAPDPIPWARERDVDLMLAGHTHGGHIRLPLIGPTVCPSRFGVKYASGLFYEEPTVLHVSRGLSGLDPLRFNCPPELTRLILRCPDRANPAAASCSPPAGC
jgi:predicted MPP superfamily phosphohydrolase